MNELREWLSALMTPIIGFLGVWIAFRQYKSQQYALRRDIMSQRLEIFNAIKTLIQDGLNFTLKPDEVDRILNQFDTATVSATFLFKDEVVKYIDELRKKYVEMWNISEILDISDTQANDVFSEIEMKQSLDNRAWMRAQLLEAKNVFKKHMDMSDV